MRGISSSNDGGPAGLWLAPDVWDFATVTARSATPGLPLLVHLGTFSSASDVTDHRIETASLEAEAPVQTDH
jgi:hypothetical protein